MGPHADAGGSARAARLCGGPSNTSDRGRPRNATLIVGATIQAAASSSSSERPGCFPLDAVAALALSLSAAAKPEPAVGFEGIEGARLL